MCMNYKRALGFGALLWVFVFILWSIIAFLPWLKDIMWLQYVIWYVVEIPLVLLLAKWYFKQDKPNLKKGVVLGVIGLIVAAVLDLVITVPLFIGSYSQFYGQWMLWVGFVLVLVLTAIAGAEFDGPVSKTEKVEAPQVQAPQPEVNNQVDNNQE